MKSTLLAALACLSFTVAPASAASLLARHTLGADAGRVDVLKMPGGPAPGQLGLR